MFTPGSARRKIDIHAHILPEHIPDFEQEFGYGGFIKLVHHEGEEKSDMIKEGRLFRKVDRNCWDIEQRVREMDKCHVNVQAISTVPVMFCYWAKPEHTAVVARFLNDDIVAQCKKHPTRFVPMGTLPMNDTQLAIQELRRCVSTHSMRTFEIGSHVNENSLDSLHFDPLWKMAEELDVCLFVHPWDMHNWDGRLNAHWMPWLVGMPAETAQAICSILMGGVLERFPKLRFCFAHGGGAYPMIQARIAHGFHVRPDLCATSTSIPPQTHHGRFYCDSLVHDPNALRLLLSVVGKDRVVLGTDYPFPLGELKPGKVVEEYSEFCAEDRDQVLWKNALEMLRIAENDIHSLSFDH